GVLGLAVAMHHAAFRRVSQRARRLEQDVTHFVHLELGPLPQDRRKRLSAQELHDEEDHRSLPPDAVDRDDVRMLELSRSLGLALETLDEGGVECEHRRKHLDRDFAVERTLARSVHDGHSAASQLLEYLVIGLERG